MGSGAGAACLARFTAGSPGGYEVEVETDVVVVVKTFDTTVVVMEVLVEVFLEVDVVVTVWGRFCAQKL